MFACTSGRHTWGNADDAAHCCNGFLRCLEIQTINGRRLMGYVWVPLNEATQAHLSAWARQQMRAAEQDKGDSDA